MDECSTDVAAEEQIKSRASLLRGDLSSVHRRHHNHHHCRRRHRHRHIYVIVIPLLVRRRSTEKEDGHHGRATSPAIIHFLVFRPTPPSYFIRAHLRSLTASYRCFHHSPEGPRLPLLRSYLALFPFFSYVPLLWLRVPSPRLIISALIGSKEFRVG